MQHMPLAAHAFLGAELHFYTETSDDPYHIMLSCESGIRNETFFMPVIDFVPQGTI